MAVLVALIQISPAPKSIAASGFIQASIVEVSSVKETVPLRFGSVDSGSNIRIKSQGIFHISSDPRSGYAFTKPVSAVLVSGKHRMTVYFDDNPNADQLVGAQEVEVSANLFVPSEQAPGLYVGKYPMAVDYN